jgi:hypothetical protein
MKPETLKEIKKSIRSFENVIDTVLKSFEGLFPHLTTMSVIVHNMGHDSVDSFQYDHETNIKELETNLLTLKTMCDYYDSHFEKMIYQQVECIISGTSMSAEIEEMEATE